MPYVFPAPTTTNAGIYSHISPSFVDKNKENGSLTSHARRCTYELRTPPTQLRNLLNRHVRKPSSLSGKVERLQWRVSALSFNASSQNPLNFTQLNCSDFRRDDAPM